MFWTWWRQTLSLTNRPHFNAGSTTYDLQVERVSRTSGISNSESEDDVLSAWAEVASQVSDELGRSISLLRIDSIVWQSGQIIEEHEPSQEAARDALIDHFEEVGIETEQAETLAQVLTAEM